jgi:hypothetical protein
MARARAMNAPSNNPVTPVPFTGMAGYSERGAPADWDTAMGEVYGYRWWYLVLSPRVVGYLNGYLRAVSADRLPGVLYGANNRPWKDGRLEAVCTKSPNFITMSRPEFIHQPPETREACGCGFWAYFNKGLYVDRVLPSNFAGPLPYLGSYGAVIPVFGVVKGTGRVIIGEKGFRSQYAQIMGLCLPQVAVNQLSWWVKDESQLRTDVWYDPFSLPDHEKCSEAEHITRVTEVESTLATGYPSAKIFSSQELLTQYYPPDKNYA